MKKNIAVLIITLFITISAKAQHLFFIGEYSYPCSETFTLKSDANVWYITDLNIAFAKDGKKALITFSTETKNVLIKEKLIIYLNDGSVITLNDGISEYVNKVAKAAYRLTDVDLEKMKNSNINNIRYSLETEYGDAGAFGGNFSASNNSKIDFGSLLTAFYNE